MTQKFTTASFLSNVATLNMPTNLRDFLSFYIIFHFRFGILKVATSGSSMHRNLSNPPKKVRSRNRNSKITSDFYQKKIAVQNIRRIA